MCDLWYYVYFLANINILSAILLRSSKKVLEKSKFFQKKDKNLIEDSNNKDRQLYVQVLFTNIQENFPNIFWKRIKEVYKNINKPRKKRPRINITTKRLLRKQIIILISTDNTSKFMFLSSEHIANIDKVLKNIKSEVIADFVYVDHWELIITTNKVISHFDINTIESNIKNINVINSEDIMTSHLSQSKSYLKIIGIPYIMEDTNVPINSSIVESIIKSIHIFNHMCLMSKPYVIKISPKFNIEIIWVDI